MCPAVRQVRAPQPRRVLTRAMWDALVREARTDATYEESLPNATVCPFCGGVSRVETSRPPFRYRKCECGARWKTQEVIQFAIESLLERLLVLDPEDETRE